MKKFIFISLAILSVACSKEAVSEIEFVKTIDIPENMVKLSITVPREPETRATMASKQLSFAADDEIAVIGTLNAVTSIQTLEVESITPSAITFSTAIDKDMEIGEYAYYPVSIANKDYPTRINWPSSFNGTKVQLPMMAKIDVSGPSAVFHYLGAMLKVNLSDAPSDVNTLEFKTASNFVGSYDVTFSGNDVNSVVANTLSGNTETLSVNPSSMTTYYVPIPAGTYSEFQLGMKRGSYYYKQRTSDLDDDITPSLGNMVNLGDFDYDVDSIEEWYMICKLQKSPWTMSDKSIRFIKIADHQYRAATNNANDSGDYGYKIQYGSPASYSWDKTTGAKTANQSSGDLKENGNNCYYGTSNVIYAATINTSTWKYNNDYVNAADAFNFSTIDMVGDFNSWSTSSNKISFDKGGAHNWSKSITVSSNTKVEFKIIANSQWEYGNWGGVNITDATPYGTGTYRNTGDPDTARDSYTLTPGDYMVYFNDAKGDIMFVRQPYSE